MVMPLTGRPPALLVKVQVAVELMSVPVGAAIACTQNGMPAATETDWDEGFTVIEVTPVRDTVMLAEPVATPLVAVMLAVPAPAPVTSPAEETLATVASLVVQVVPVEPVMFFCVPSS